MRRVTKRERIMPDRVFTCMGFHSGRGCDTGRLTFGICFEVWIGDANDAPAFWGHLGTEVLRLRERGFIECKVPFAFCMLDVKPQCVKGHSVPVKVTVKSCSLRLAPHIPMALVVSHRPERRHCRRASVLNELP